MHNAEAHTAALPPVTVIAQIVGVRPGVRRVGGTERQVGLLINGYLDAGGAVTLICLRSAVPDHPLLTTYRLPIPDRPFVIAEPLFILLATITLALRGRGVIHSTGAIVLSRVDATTVHFCHTALASSHRGRRVSRDTPWHALNALAAAKLSVAMEGWCYRRSRARAFVGPSDGLAAELMRFFPDISDSVRVIGNGIERARFANVSHDVRARARHELDLPDAAAVATFVGGDWERKGLSKAIEALTSAPAWRLVVVGDGDRRRYERFAEDLGVRQRVRFAGPRVDVERMYAAADAFVFPSDYEAAPLVTYEAAASGLPLLVSRMNGAADLVVPGLNGWFVESAAEIGSYLNQLSSDSQLRARMGEAARAASESHTQERMVAAYAALYRELNDPSRR